MLRFTQNREEPNYLSYGPYWYALKKVLKANGHDFGSFDVPELSSVYKADDNEQTITAGEMFRDMYLGRFFWGTNAFVLDADAEEVEINDPDML